MILEQLWDGVRIIAGVWLVAAAVAVPLILLFGIKHGGIAAITVLLVGLMLFGAYKAAESEQKVQHLQGEQRREERRKEQRREEQRREEQLQQKKQL